MEKVNPGKYVVAVSGGVDSMVLLDMLRRQKTLQLVVAHVDHGIRADSHKDANHVQQYAEKRGLLFMTTRLHLGAHPSEAAARKARYAFLRRCSENVQADGIILAHHQDDVIETAIIALLRGTGWRGLAPFIGGQKIIRPLVNLTKNDILAYARTYDITWCEDSTNADESYLRNYVRRTIIPTLDQKCATWQNEFLQHIRNQQEVRKKVENELTKWLDNHVTFHNNFAELKRYDFIMVPRAVAYELLQQIFRQLTGNSVERPLAEAALLFIKVAKPQKTFELTHGWQLRSESANVIVVPRTP